MSIKINKNDLICHTGALTKDPHEVFDFIVKLIGQAKRRPGAVSMEGLHHCLNRTILFLLSRATDSIADQMAVLEALHKLTTHRYAYIPVLVYCILLDNMYICFQS